MIINKSVLLFTLSLLVCTLTAIAEPISARVTVLDGLDIDNPENIADDYVRLQLPEPDYATASQIKQAVELWLGPDMVDIQSGRLLRVQAPRNPSERVEFIAALLGLEIPEGSSETPAAE